MNVAQAVARPTLARSNRWSMTNLAGISDAVPGPPGHRDHEVVDLDHRDREQDGRRDQHRPQDRQHDREIDTPGRDAVDPRRFPQVLVDAPQPREQDRHDQPGGLPHPGDHQRVDHLLVDEPVEGEALPAGVVQLLQAERRVEEPLPDQAGDDERHGVRVEVDGAQRALGAHALVDEGGEQEPEYQAADQKQRAEHHQILNRHQKSSVAEQARVLIEADEIEGRQHLRAGERQPHRPQHAAEVDDDHGQGRGDQRQHRRQAARDRPPPRRERDGDGHGQVSR